MSFSTPIGSLSSNLTSRVLWPQFVNPIAGTSSIYSTTLEWGHIWKWNEVSKPASSPDNIPAWILIGGFGALFLSSIKWGAEVLMVFAAPFILLHWMFAKTLGPLAKRWRRRRNSKRKARQDGIALQTRRADLRRRLAVEELIIPRREKSLQTFCTVEDVERRGGMFSSRFQLSFLKGCSAHVSILHICLTTL